MLDSTVTSSIRRHAPAVTWLLTGLVAASTVLGTAWAALHRSDPLVAAAAAPVAVTVNPAESLAGYRSERRFVGRVEPVRAGELAFELAGRLDAVTVEEGDRVAAGEVLARLDVKRLAARRGELEADLARIRAEVALAAATRDRVTELVASGHASGQELDEAREGHRSLRAALESARARIRSIDVDLGKSVLKAPYAAVVTRRLADEGSVLATGQPLLRLQEWRPPEARVGVVGRALDGLRVGQDHLVHQDGQALPATVKAILPVRTAATRTVDVVLSLQVAPDRLRAGDLVELRLPLQVPEPGFWVPQGGLTAAPRGLWSVYVAEPASGVTPGHRITPRLVEVIAHDSDRAYVRGTLRAGDLLVTSGLHRVVPGQRVTLAAGAGS